jgi:hypothetical protein
MNYQLQNFNIKIVKSKAESKGDYIEYYGDQPYTDNISRIIIKSNIADSCIEAIHLAIQSTLVLKIGLNSELDLKNEIINNFLNLQHNNLNLLADN